MTEKKPELCHAGCTFKEAVKATPNAKVPHPKADQYAGWKHMSGACRADNPDGDGLVRVNARNSLEAGAGGKSATQKECKDHCEAEKDCIGYAHKENSWCINYGPGLDVATGIWNADTTPVSGPISDKTKVNVEYICGVKVDILAAPKIEEQVSESCRPGAMLALAFWLTRLWQ